MQGATSSTQGQSLVWETQTASAAHASGIEEELYVIDRQCDVHPPLSFPTPRQ